MDNWDLKKISMEILGWFGAINLLIAYYLIQTKRVTLDHNLYLILNIVGAFCLMINTVYYRAYPSVVTNLVWFVIGTIVAINLWCKDSVTTDYERI